MNEEQLELWFKQQKQKLENQYFENINNSLPRHQRRQHFLNNMKKLYTKYRKKQRFLVIKNMIITKLLNPINEKLSPITKPIIKILGFVLKPLKLVFDKSIKPITQLIIKIIFGAVNGIISFTQSFCFVIYNDIFGLLIKMIKKIGKFLHPLYFWNYPPFTQFYEFLNLLKKSSNLNNLQAVINKTMNKTIEEIMTKKVITITKQDTLKKALEIMNKQEIGTLIVTEGNIPIATLSERDLMKKMQYTKEFVETSKVEQLMTELDYVATKDTTIIELLEMMAKSEIRKIPIVDKKIRGMIGLITTADLLKYIDIFYTKIVIESNDIRQVRGLMNTNVLMVNKEELMSNVLKQMKEANSDYAIILEKDKPIGIFTVRNLLEKTITNTEQMELFKIDQIMTSPFASISPDKYTFEANHIMLEKNFRRIPVMVDSNLMGIITQKEIIKGMYSFFSLLTTNLAYGKIKKEEQDENKSYKL